MQDWSLEEHTYVRTSLPFCRLVSPFIIHHRFAIEYLQLNKFSITLGFAGCAVTTFLPTYIDCAFAISIRWLYNLVGHRVLIKSPCTIKSHMGQKKKLKGIYARVRNLPLEYSVGILNRKQRQQQQKCMRTWKTTEANNLVRIVCQISYAQFYNLGKRIYINIFIHKVDADG